MRKKTKDVRKKKFRFVILHNRNDVLFCVRRRELTDYEWKNRLLLQ